MKARQADAPVASGLCFWVFEAPDKAGPTGREIPAQGFYVVRVVKSGGSLRCSVLLSFPRSSFSRRRQPGGLVFGRGPAGSRQLLFVWTQSPAPDASFAHEALADKPEGATPSEKPGLL